MYAGFNGLISAQGDFAIVMTGTAYGQVKLTVDGRLSAPEATQLAPWDDVVEVSLVMRNGQARISAGMGVVVPDLPPISVAGPGPYRVRVHARGRDRALAVTSHSEPADPVEEHLVITWPGAKAPEVRYKLTDACGAAIRAR
jgi:hypothetical protein